MTLDLGFTGALDPASLAGIEVPVLVMAAGGRNPRMNAELESRRLAALLGDARLVEIAGASHFSFMGECRPGGYALLKAESPGDEIVCLDGDLDRPGDRAGLHRLMLGEILGFLAEAGVM